MKRITKIGVNETPLQKKKIKVAAYCRVSTASDEQIITVETRQQIVFHLKSGLNLKERLVV